MSAMSAMKRKAASSEMEAGGLGQRAPKVKRTELAFGTTPWDSCDAKQLYELATKSWKVLEQTRLLLDWLRARECPDGRYDSGFFGPGGTGGTAYAYVDEMWKIFRTREKDWYEAKGGLARVMEVETPIRHVQRLYLAVTSSLAACGMHHSFIHQGLSKETPAGSPWGPGGRGDAIYEALQTLVENEFHALYDDECLYFTFFRYAPQLLFFSCPHPDRWWVVCNVCGDLTGGAREHCFAMPCRDDKCTGSCRDLQWTDLKGTV